MKIQLLITILSAITILASADSGDTLYVSVTKADLKVDSDPESETVITLSEGHKLVEIYRSKEWIMVGPEKIGGKMGWLPISATSADVPKKETERFKTDEFERFQDAFWKLSNKIEKQSGIKFFTEAEYMGDGIIQITATDVWLSAPSELRKGNMQTIYDLWEATDGSGLPIAVYFLDSKGVRRFSKNKK